jgi:hypothetical protein
MQVLESNKLKDKFQFTYLLFPDLGVTAYKGLGGE